MTLVKLKVYTKQIGKFMGSGTSYSATWSFTPVQKTIIVKITSQTSQNWGYIYLSSWEFFDINDVKIDVLGVGPYGSNPIENRHDWGPLANLIDGDSIMMEREPLERATQMGELMAYKHEGFWQCMDTKRDHEMLQKLWAENKAPWKVN